VHLTVRIAVRILAATAVGVSTKLVEGQSPKGAGAPAYPVSPRDSRLRDGDVVLVDSERGFLEVRRTCRDLPIRISGSDWIHEFAPKLDIGQFVVFEIPQPPLIGGTGTDFDRINEAIISARKAEQELRSGNWDDVMETLRGVWELLRNQQHIRDLLERDGYTPEAAEAFDKALQSLFTLSSKFVHRLDQSRQRIMAEIKPSKEDAYLAFGLAMGALNLVARKHHRLT